MFNDNGNESFAIGYPQWKVESIESLDNGGYRYKVYKDEESHKTLTYSGANFLCQMFNEQDQWFNWGRHSGYNTITLSSSDGLSIGHPYSFHNPPAANVKLFFGDSEQEYSTYFQFWLKKPPNRLQRWLLAKAFGIKMILLK